jgi:hypothetical protein
MNSLSPHSGNLTYQGNFYPSQRNINQVGLLRKQITVGNTELLVRRLGRLHFSPSHTVQKMTTIAQPQRSILFKEINP